MEKSYRSKYMDIMKGLGIIYVVVGHTLINPLHDFIYFFHMPLFFFISGYFYNEKYSLNPQSLIKKRLKSLYIPFIKYQFIFLVLHNFFYYLNFYNEKIVFQNESVKLYETIDFIKNSIRTLLFMQTEQLVGPFWFLTVLFFVTVFFSIMRYFLFNILKINKEFLIVTAVIIFYLVSTVLKNKSITFRSNIQWIGIYLLIFYFGFLYKKIETKLKFNIYISIFSVFILSFGTINGYYNDTGIGPYLFLQPIMYIIFALAGIYLNMYVSIKLSSKKLKLLVYIGKHSLIIMAFHILAFKIINIFQVYMYDQPAYLIASFPVLDANNYWWIAYSVVGVLIPLLVPVIKDSFIKWNFARK